MRRWSNTDAPGIWLYRVGNIGPNENVEPPEFPGSVRPGTLYCIMAFWSNILKYSMVLSLRSHTT